jgi:toxin ParE1/3/4
MYNIIRTEKADNQLRDILFYIADDSGNVETALKYLDKLESSIMRLAEFPDSGSIPRYSILRKQGFRVLIVERNLIFYKTDHIKKEVIIYAVVDGRQEYINLI